MTLKPHRELAADTERNRRIYERRESGETLASIGADYSLTRERVRVIHREMKRRMTKREYYLDRIHRSIVLVNVIAVMDFMRDYGDIFESARKGNGNAG